VGPVTDRVIDADDVADGDTDRPADRVDEAVDVAADTADTSADTASNTDDATATVATRPGWRARRRNRISKWDRPPEPKDWRYFVGTLGKVLIATGILMFGFVAYQLWGTGIETARAQSALEDKFEEAIAANQDDDPPNAPDATDATDAADAADADAADADFADAADEETELTTIEPAESSLTPAEDPTVDPGAGVGGGAPSEIVPGGVDLSEQAIEQNVPVVAPNEPMALLEIPEIDVDVLVVPGVTHDDLKKGPGHYPDTPLPGQLGNASIAGHRTTYGAPFFDLDKLEPGDEMIVTMITGDQFVYRVTGSEIVGAGDSWVITTRDPDVAELTLTTCHPKYTARDRLVIHSVLVPERSAQVGVAEFWDHEDTEDSERPAGDDPTFDSSPSADAAVVTTVADESGDARSGDAATGGDKSTVESSADGAAAESGDRTDAVFLDDGQASEEAETVESETVESDAVATATDTTTPSTPAPGPAASGELDEDAEIDAFSEGWFDDRDAFSQIALWGVALTLISLLAYQVSKRTRHDSIGFLFGIAPFLFCLYFFFQNINRLLPPGL
jgi:sortase A